MASGTALFPKIGDQAGGLTTSPTVDDDEKAIQQIESLCMRCEEQARIHDHLLKCLNGYCQLGSYSTFVNFHSLL